MADDYADLNLDDILEIALADKNNSTEITNQAAAVNSLMFALEDTIRGSRDAQTHLDGNMNVSERNPAEDAASAISPIGFTVMAVMESLSTGATSQQTKALIETGIANLPTLHGQTEIFSQIAHETVTVYNDLDGMRTERNEHIRLYATDPEDPALNQYAIPEGATPEEAATKIREYHNAHARTRMSKSTSSYVAAIDALPMPTPYEGPRMPRPEPPPTGPGNPGGNGAVTRPGPLLTRDQPPIGDPPPPPPPPPAVPPGGERPDLQGPGAPPPPPPIGQPLPTPMPPPVGTGPGPVPPPPGIFVPNRPVTPPVIGNRGGPPPGNRSPFTPNRTGLNRPVIGERPGKSNPAAPPRGTNPPGRGSTPPGRGSTPPGRGSTPPGRGGTPPGRGTMPPGRGTTPSPGRNPAGKALPPGRGGQGGRGVPGRPIPPPGSQAGRGGTPMPRPGTPAPRAPGVRNQPAPKPTTGPVRGRPEPGQRPNPSQPTRITRTPKMHHGGNDVNRPVIGRSKGAKKYRDDEEQLQSTMDNQENQWFDVSGTTPPVLGRKSDRTEEHDPGDYITNRNLGRRDWSGD